MHSNIAFPKSVFQFSMVWFLVSIIWIGLDFYCDFYFFSPFKKFMEELEKM